MHKRPGMISASQVSTILGINPFESAYALWARKTGEIPWPEQNIVMRVGHALEPFIAELYIEQTKREVVDPGDYFIQTHPEFPWLFSTPDRFELIRDWLVEIKNTAINRKEWANGAGPLVAQVQLQIQMACSGMTGGALACLFANREFYRHNFFRKDSLIKKILVQLSEFHERCLNGDPPPIDGSQSSTDALKTRFVHKKDKKDKDGNPTVVFIDGLSKHVHEINRINAQMTALLKEKETHTNPLKDAIGDDVELVTDGMKVTWKHSTTKGGYKRASHSRRLNVPQ